MPVFNENGATQVPSATAEFAFMETGDSALKNCTPAQAGEALARDGYGVRAEDTIQGLRDSTSTAPIIYVRAHTTAGDGGHGNFRLVTGAAPGTYVDDNGTIIVPTGGDGSAGWLRVYSGHVNVQWFGGTTDAAFSAAAKAAVAGNAQDLQYAAIPFADWATVFVPAGVYTLTTYIDTNNREIVWLLDVAAEVTGYQYLNGRIVRGGSKTVDFHHGTHDQAVTLSIMANRNLDEVSPVAGFTNPNQLSKGNGRDSVGAYIGSRLPATLYSTATAATYTASGVTFSPALSTAQMRQMRKGMIVETKHATKYAAYIESWTSTTITVADGWFLVDGSATGTPATPANTAGIDINPFRKVWALNANAFIDTLSHGNKINTVEFGLINEKGASVSDGGSVEANGVYMVNIPGTGDYGADNAFLVSGKWQNGFASYGGSKFGFMYKGDSTPTQTLLSLLYGTGADGLVFFNVKPDGSVEAGKQGASGTVVYDFHTGATNVDYDARIQASGGTGVTGGGTLQIIAATHTITAPTTNINATTINLGAATINLDATTSIDADIVLRPSTDGNIGLGQSARRWSSIYATTVRPGDGTALWTTGTGSPEANVTAVVGSMFTRLDGGAGTTLYIKESGTGNTGWVAK